LVLAGQRCTGDDIEPVAEFSGYRGCEGGLGGSGLSGDGDAVHVTGFAEQFGRGVVGEQYGGGVAR
jgi:hypothetical protein